MKAKLALAMAGMLLVTSVSLPVRAETSGEGTYDTAGSAEIAETEGTALGETLAEDEEDLVGRTYHIGYTEEISEPTNRSGILTDRPLTKIEVANLYQNAMNTTAAFAYEITPSITSPYKAGKAAESNRTAALTRVNMYRAIAGLTPVEESEELSDSAQHGAVVLAANGVLTHYPDQPSDMDDDFYKIAFNATSSSNLGAGYSRIEYGVDGCMRDNSGSNLTSVGHRRWFLNPAMLYIGFGEASGSKGYRTFYDYKVFDESNGQQDFNYVAWPSSGNFPVELLSSKLPWSIEFNDYRYEYADEDDIKVEITNPDGTTEVFSMADNSDDTTGQTKYFNIDFSGCGMGGICLICNFGDNYNDFTKVGEYQVKVTGLSSRTTGETVTVEYKTTMFNASDYAGKTAVTDEQYDQIGEFVERLYTKCLERDSEASGKLYWTMLLADGDMSGADVGSGFVFSQEYLGKETDDETFLEMMYQVFLGREADEGGLEYWSNMLENGVSRNFVYHGFAESVEYNQICEDYGIERGTVTLTEGRDLNAGATMFVYRIYDKVLNRAAEEAGLNDWAGQIARGETSAETVAKLFFASEEFLNRNLNDMDYVETLYETFLGRASDVSGKSDWLSKLEDGSYTRDEVLEGFSQSAEFAEIMASYGL